MIKEFDNGYRDRLLASDFLKKYPWASTFVKTSKYYELFLIFINDEFVVDEMVEKNDKESVPPLYTFMHASNIKNYAHITPYELRCLGALVSYVFKNFLEYDINKNIRINDLLYPMFYSGSIFLKKNRCPKG